MKQIGTVESLNGDNVQVRVKRVSACGGNCVSCGASCGGGEIVVTAQNNAGANVGDMVEIEMPSTKILGAPPWVYIVPGIFFIIGYMIFDKLFATEPWAILGGFGMMAAVYVVIIMQNRKNKNKYRLTVEKII